MSVSEAWKGQREIAGVPVDVLAREPAGDRYEGLDSEELKALLAYEAVKKAASPYSEKGK